jgi:hypothetical protein
LNTTMVVILDVRTSAHRTHSPERPQAHLCLMCFPPVPSPAPHVHNGTHGRQHQTPARKPLKQ